MCLKSTERSRIITKDCSKIVGDKKATENFPIHKTPIKLDENPVQLTSTESLLLLPVFVETSFVSILTKVSCGRVPLMRLFTTFPQLFTSTELFVPLIAGRVPSEMCNHENAQNYNVGDVINIIMLYFF